MSEQHFKKLLWLAVATVVTVNGVILSKVFINRSAILAEFPLTERELRLPNQYGFAGENSGKRIGLKWTTPNPEPISDEWQYQYRHTNRAISVSDAHFASFQFQPCLPGRYRRQQQRAWVLLEFNGQSYADYLTEAEQYYALVQQVNPELTAEVQLEQQQRAADLLQTANERATRLYVIDAAATAELLQPVLAARPTTADSRLVIVPAEIQASYHRCAKTEQTKLNEIIVTRLAVQSLYVPKRLAAALPQNNDKIESEPLRAIIYYGKLHEPWISNLE
ncbi:MULTISPECIES: DUF4824 family protein [unclassified Arsukibacterium]|uniref:DUF4824 family protein n=1 Tax=unclassified Arsukibacterium TaxID=2635278 RepID=UPI000C630D9B|nr:MULTISPECIES: DUF4824 family protein [unclassified Arsukibacterium]MAA96151.1 hypothetical protein [Rheinheimera sp.]MBM34342.1 hypothetical protein [Rheinheimera sp.]HAW93449.1 hypothetical protein [Candidatus Azambacteria bacterium]|tara:strand:+ start:1998 stop:2831 length:834 start_codon:yes stop_codon:yes gene_type:complete